ncbi:somatostatin-1 [Phyllopteryx taeniolatus]|uniref:somatostatin-1 n=1 Tax=Phyllopteryx taeniolatus TaxID=161469 RepID=UPI002AD52229|nr:somatostatin-1 [Phyllopteryx taeniolatus]XP_061620107.1 somatostatin-1 [Phyllopteryx taeniolatus]XP_061620108.1 somatostatin-1 [Phyllopteryx taeniolatus]XP_061620109.1 somatostatin-1 [Phyllopteryx taeniolatus]XP_061620110.1 somatostatin-1 [Phyllopteryx taeniolatus]
MLQRQARVLLVLLLSAGPLVRVSAGDPDAADRLAEGLGADAALDKALTRSLLLRLLYDAAARDEALPELGVGVALMRRHLPLSQRERKAGCRNFFWKTFTSC